MSDDLALLPDEVRLAAHVLANGDADYVRSTAMELADRRTVLVTWK